MEWRDQARALEGYLRDKLLQGPALGIQRRVEARIGELLGEAEPGKRTDLEPLPHEGQVRAEVPKNDRSDFRLLAKAGKGKVELKAEEWRRSRRGLVALVRQRAGLVPDQPALPEGSYRCIVAAPAERQAEIVEALRTTAGTAGESESMPTAGWYADPESQHTWRWWDGQQWTDHVG